METQRIDPENYLSYLFLAPVALISCHNLDAVPDSFRKLESFLGRGYWAAGFFSYELGYAFEDFKAKNRFGFPLIWIGIFKQPLIFDHRRGQFLNKKAEPFFSHKVNPASGYCLKDIKFNKTPIGYTRDIKRIKDNIAKGFTYQVNYTLKCKFKFHGSRLSLYNNLRNNQPVAYSAFIKDRQFSILSFSPELFFRKEGRIITTRPMKGTISRGKNKRQDQEQVSRLRGSPKDKSENIMIVDLLRNDLGRISEVDSVRATELYSIEKYKTLFQMTSTVRARLKSELSLYGLFKSIFPSGSVTGAPKIRTMGIIRQLEREERGVYTGAIGFFKPNRDAVFNVAIRTLILEGKSGQMGIGSGIVYDSKPLKEHKECRLKAMFFELLGKRSLQVSSGRGKEKYELIETMKWSKKTGFSLLAYHLDRLRASAEYFNFSFNEKEIKAKLCRINKRLNKQFSYRLRLLLNREGRINLGYQRIKEIQEGFIPEISFSRQRMYSKNVFLYHKTTNRAIYEKQYNMARKNGLWDVIFENEKGEVTEGAISNIFIRKGRMYYTPPVRCGLLSGVYRQYFIKKNSRLVKEKVLRRKDLIKAEAIFLTNALRGMMRVRLRL